MPAGIQPAGKRLMAIDEFLPRPPGGNLASGSARRVEGLSDATAVALERSRSGSAVATRIAGLRHGPPGGVQAAILTGGRDVCRAPSTAIRSPSSHRLPKLIN